MPGFLTQRLARHPEAGAFVGFGAVFLFFALTVLAAIRMFDAESTRDLILYAVGAVVAFVIAAACKMYLYMQMDRHALEDRLERIEQMLDASR